MVAAAAAAGPVTSRAAGVSVVAAARQQVSLGGGRGARSLSVVGAGEGRSGGRAQPGQQQPRRPLVLSISSSSGPGPRRHRRPDAWPLSDPALRNKGAWCVSLNNTHIARPIILAAAAAGPSPRNKRNTIITKACFNLDIHFILAQLNTHFILTQIDTHFILALPTHKAQPTCLELLLCHKGHTNQTLFCKL